MTAKSLFSMFNNNVVREFSKIAPSPQRDFYQFLITKTKFIWRWWKITARNDGGKFHPGEVVDTYEDFINDERLHSEVRRVFDRETLEYALNVAQGQLDVLPRLPRPILMYVFAYLQLEDIVNLGYTCKTLNQVCNDETVWQELYCRFNSQSSPDSVAELADSFGWKRLFFTNKLQLQVQLRRQKVRHSDRKSPVPEEAACKASPPIDDHPAKVVGTPRNHHTVLRGGREHMDETTLADAEIPLDRMMPPGPIHPHHPLLPPSSRTPRPYATSTIAGAIEDWNDLESEFCEQTFFDDTEEDEDDWRKQHQETS